jgi:beta-lactamase class A
MSRLGIRRRLVGALAAGCALPLLPAVAAPSARRLSTAEAEARLAALEAQSGGRLGVFVLDTGSGLGLAHRGGERFGLCSTFKLPLAAVILREHAAGRLDGHAPIALDATPAVSHAPVVTAALEAGRMQMSALELARATQTTSDNVAANLLLDLLGGPQRFTTLLRALGDDTTRLDRYETEMNRVGPGELRDTSTPQAMARLAARLFGPGLLDASSQRVLAHWMVETRTGLARLRAGLPADWRVGDKTGTALIPGLPNRHNDVAVAWPPRRPPITIAAYYEADGHYPRMRAEDDAVLAEAARIASAWTG